MLLLVELFVAGQNFSLTMVRRKARKKQPDGLDLRLTFGGLSKSYIVIWLRSSISFKLKHAEARVFVFQIYFHESPERHSLSSLDYLV